mmetsp:Transcript_62047/g.145580  ORF Transcript_62047/g.145580 Transcript_62047/m.145580 type:complete len:545 (+) Transcript_62047:114-1748(+)
MDGAAKKDDSLENGDEKVTLLGGKQRRECSWTCGAAEFLDDLAGAIGYKLLFLLFVVEHVNRGFVADFSGQAESYVYKTYAVPAPRVQIYSGISKLPWALKPVVGLISDVMPIGGYHKAPYMIGAVFVGSAAFLAAGAVPHSMLPVSLLVVCIFLQQSQLSVCDILAEARYAQQIQEVPAFGSHVLSFVWFGMNAGSVLGVSLSGLLLANASPKLPFLISALPAAMVLIPLFYGCLEEKMVRSEETAERRKKFYAQREACFLSLLICVVCLGLTACGLISSSTRVNAIAATIAFFVVGFFFSVFLSPAIARFNLWSLLQTSLSLSTSGAAFYFMTDTEEQYNEGPHFSPLYYNSVIGTVGALMSLVGVATFQRYFSTYRYRNLLLVTNIAFCFMNALDTVLFKRLNVSMGIPDHAFVLGTSCMQNVLMQWQWMPQVIILSYFCPRGMEATMYALLAGCHNLGNTIASCWGALLLESLDVNPTGSVGESAQFDNLWKASLLASLMPIITVVALFHFIPDVKQGDPVVDPNAEATQGSLWRQFWDA